MFLLSIFKPSELLSANLYSMFKFSIVPFSPVLFMYFSSRCAFFKFKMTTHYCPPSLLPIKDDQYCLSPETLSPLLFTVHSIPSPLQSIPSLHSTLYPLPSSIYPLSSQYTLSPPLFNLSPLFTVHSILLPSSIYPLSSQYTLSPPLSSQYTLSSSPLTFTLLCSLPANFYFSEHPSNH